MDIIVWLGTSLEDWGIMGLAYCPICKENTFCRLLWITKGPYGIPVYWKYVLVCSNCIDGFNKRLADYKEKEKKMGFWKSVFSSEEEKIQKEFWKFVKNKGTRIKGRKCLRKALDLCDFTKTFIEKKISEEEYLSGFSSAISGSHGLPRLGLKVSLDCSDPQKVIEF